MTISKRDWSDPDHCCLLLFPGDLKQPSYSIPRGTIAAVIFTYLVYNLLAVLLSCTCDRYVLDRPPGGTPTLLLFAAKNG